MFIMKSLQRYIAILLASLLLLSAAHVASAETTASTAVKVPNGEYDVNFHVLKNDSTEPSYAEAHLRSTTGKLIANNGTYKLRISFINYDWYEYWGSLKPGGKPAGSAEAVSEYESATVVEVTDGNAVRGQQWEDKLVTGYNGTVEFPIQDVKAKQDVLMHIVVKDLYPVKGGPALEYDNWYMAQVVIDTTNIPFVPVDENPSTGTPDVTREDLSWQITIANSLYTSTDGQEGNWNGAYAPGARASLLYAINEANKVESSSSASDEEIKTAYQLLTQAIKLFGQQRVTVNKTALLTAIQDAEAYAKTLTYVTNAGVYAANAIIGITSSSIDVTIANARTVYDDAKATQAQVDEKIAAIQTIRAFIEGSRTIASDVRLIVLDSLEANAVASAKGSLFGSTATILKRNTPREHANITISNDIDINSITYYRPATDGTRSFVTELPLKLIATGLNAGTERYSAQLQQRNTTFADQTISGIVKLTYSTKAAPSVTEEVYLSLNGTLLDNLNASIAQASELYGRASAGDLSGQYNTADLAALKTAIDTAAVTGSLLSATRNEIAAASTALNTAVNTFLSTQRTTLHYSVAHSTDAVFSIADSYFKKPASVVQVGDHTYDAAIQVNNSAQVADFNYKQADGSYAAADVLYVNTTDNYRVVQLNNVDTSQLLDVHLHVVNSEAKLDQTYQVRLNFNGVDNALLSSEYLTALTQWSNAKAGTAKGEYPETAIVAFKNAIDAAGQAAVAADGTQVLTDSAVLALRQAVSAFQASVNTTNVDNGSGAGTPGTSTDPQYPQNGKYYIPFTVFKYGTTSISVADTYLVSPALVTVTDGSKSVSFTIVQSAEITSLTIGGSSGTITSSDATKNTRVVTFNLPNLSTTLNAWVKVDWSSLNYHHQYDIQFKFDESRASYAGTAGTVVDGGSVGPPNLSNPDDQKDNEEPIEEVEQQNSENSEEPTSTEQPNENQPAGPTIKFIDTANHWAKSSIERAIELGIVTGFKDGSFRPNNIVTRGEFAVMLSRALGLEGDGDTSALRDYEKIPSWAQPHVAHIAAAGIINGFEDGTFRSNGQLTRVQVAVVIARAAGLKLNQAAALSFADAADIPTWAQQEVAAAAEAGLIQGKNGNLFDPNGTATRAEAVTLIIRLLELL